MPTILPCFGFSRVAHKTFVYATFALSENCGYNEGFHLLPMHQLAETIGCPSHISTMAEIMGISQALLPLLSRLTPAYCCLATSVTGGFLPISQAPNVLAHVDDTFRHLLWPGGVNRYDVARRPSVDCVLPNQRILMSQVAWVPSGDLQFLQACQ
jgi:hypothetical protein